MININASKIDLSGKGLKNLPEELFKCKNLKKLNLSNNQLKSVPKELAMLKRLENIDLSNNLIDNLYAKFFDLSNLKVLIINNNQLRKLPRQIGNLKKLRKLSIAGNHIDGLPEELSELISLESLSIANNDFIEFPIQLLSLTSLKVLWLNNNNFRTFPCSEITSKLEKLKLLYCYSSIRNSTVDINEDYVYLTSIKGSSRGYLNALAIRGEKIVGTIDNSQDKTNLQKMEKDKIFISYSHLDDEWLKRLTTHLKAMQFEGIKFEYWDDTKIHTGQNWQEEIMKALNEAYIAILIISADFLASDFIYNNELPAILKNAEELGTKIMPIIVKPSRFTKHPTLSKFQSGNDAATPLSKLNINAQEEAWVKLTYDIERYIKPEEKR